MNKYWRDVYKKLAKRYELHIKVIKKDNSKCSDCGISIFDCDFEIHHIKPKVFGGEDILNNLTVLCKKCHKKTFIKGVWTNINIGNQN